MLCKNQSVTFTFDLFYFPLHVHAHFWLAYGFFKRIFTVYRISAIHKESNLWRLLVLNTSYFRRSSSPWRRYRSLLPTGLSARADSIAKTKLVICINYEITRHRRNIWLSWKYVRGHRVQMPCQREQGDINLIISFSVASIFEYKPPFFYAIFLRRQFTW